MLENIADIQIRDAQFVDEETHGKITAIITHRNGLDRTNSKIGAGSHDFREKCGGSGKTGQNSRNEKNLKISNRV